MNQHLTIVYCTSRQDCKVDWFLDSLAIQNGFDSTDLDVVIVDLHHSERRERGESVPWFRAQKLPDRFIYKHVPVKPNVWQGKHRLTKEDWFAAANARNTGLCLAPDGYIAYADDLSVLLPGWLDRVKAAMAGGYVACGTYRKVKNLVVKDGEVISFADYHGGHDTRTRFAPTDLHPCEGGWLFGCSCAMPVEALLTIGGWPEYCDGLGSEDYVCGLALQNAGFKLFYDKKMMTYESEELHHIGTPLKKTDKGKSPDDKSHRALNIVLSGQRYFDNYYPGAGIRDERDRVLRGEPWTIRNNPQHDWYDGKLISEM